MTYTKRIGTNVPVVWLVLTALAVCIDLTPVQAKYAVFGRHTDTISVAGQTLVSQEATYEAVFLLPSSHPHGGNVLNEFTSAQEDKTLAVYPNHIVGNSWEKSVPYGALMSLDAKRTVTTDSWHHVAMVTDRQEDRLYLDGKLVAAQARLAPIGNGSGKACVGAIYRANTTFGGVRGFAGVLDSVRVSNVARYKGLEFSPPFGDLTSDTNTLLLYNFNDPVDTTTIADDSPLGRTGVLGSGFTGATAPTLVKSLEDLPPASSRDIVLDPRAAYLRTRNDRAYNAIPISLASLAMQPGDKIFLEKIGDANETGDYETLSDNERIHLAGVFSTSSELGPPSQLHRVAGAIKAGQDYVTPVTQSGGYATDIPEDFHIPDTGVAVTIPQGAEFLFLGAVDIKYQDNLDVDANFGVHISQPTLSIYSTDQRLKLNWEAGILQSKSDLNSPYWTDVQNARSPVFLAPTNSAQFFQLRNP